MSDRETEVDEASRKVRSIRDGAARGRRAIATLLAEAPGSFWRALDASEEREFDLVELDSVVNRSTASTVGRDWAGLAHDAALAGAIAAVCETPVVWRALFDGCRRPHADTLEFVGAAWQTLELERVRVRVTDRVAYVELTNGAVLNAEDVALLRDLEVTVDLVNTSTHIDAAVLRGAVNDVGKHAGRRTFCAGINLTLLRAGAIPYRDYLLARECGLLRKLEVGTRVDRRDVRKPWIGVVDGFAIGGGMQMTLALDYVIIERSAYMSLPANIEGFIPGMAAFRMSAIGGGRWAQALITSGTTIRAESALGSGLADAMVEEKDIDGALDSAIARLTSPAYSANRAVIGGAFYGSARFAETFGVYAMEQALRYHCIGVVR